MTVCADCGKKYVSSKMYLDHLETHKAVEPEPVDPSVTIRFSRPVEVRINGVPYFGTEVKAPNIQVASEIIRIAREAYGREVLII